MEGIYRLGRNWIAVIRKVNIILLYVQVAKNYGLVRTAAVLKGDARVVGAANGYDIVFSELDWEETG